MPAASVLSAPAKGGKGGQAGGGGGGGGKGGESGEGGGGDEGGSGSASGGLQQQHQHGGLLPHLTNHCQQAGGRSYDESSHTRSLHEAFAPSFAASLLEQARAIAADGNSRGVELHTNS